MPTVNRSAAAIEIAAKYICMEAQTIIPTAESANLATILVIEDEKDIANLLAYRLVREGFRAHVAHDGGEGWRMIEVVRPDCILLDRLLPVQDGWSVCRAVRGHNNAQLAATPIVMLTALGDQDTRIRGIEKGADVFLVNRLAVLHTYQHRLGRPLMTRDHVTLFLYCLSQLLS